MALQIVWTTEANSQLNEILEYWISRNGTNTFPQKLYKSIKIALKILSKYPKSGKITDYQNVQSKIESTPKTQKIKKVSFGEIFTFLN